MIQLYLVTICILLSPPLTTSEVVVSSSPTPNVTSMATVNTKAGLTNQMNSSLQPRLPTETLCGNLHGTGQSSLAKLKQFYTLFQMSIKPVHVNLDWSVKMVNAAVLEVQSTL